MACIPSITTASIITYSKKNEIQKKKNKKIKKEKEKFICLPEQEPKVPQSITSQTGVLHVVPFQPVLQELHWFGATQEPEIQLGSEEQSGVLQDVPFHPSMQEQLSGATQVPCPLQLFKLVHEISLQ